MIISGFLWLLYGSLWLSELQFVWMWHSQMPGRSRQDGVGVAPWIVGLGWLGWVGVNMYLGWLGGSFFVSVWLGALVFVWFRNWVPCRYILKEVQRPELYIQKGVPVSWVNQYTLSSIRVLHSKDRWHSFLSDSTIKVSISPSLIYIKLISDLEVVVASCINH